MRPILRYAEAKDGMVENRLGAILLEGGLVDEESLDRCLAIQALTGGSRPIGQILVEQGLLDAATLDRLLELQGKRIEERRVDDAPTDMASASIATAAQANGASEFVVSEGRPVRIRVGSVWQALTDQELSGPEVWDFVRETMGSDVLEVLADQQFVVRRWSLPDIGSGTATAFRQFDGVAVRLTFASEATADPVALGVPEQVLNGIDAGRGLVLCVGERGAGRAELLSALTHRAARDEGHYIVVVDDEPMALPANGGLVVRRRFGSSADVQSKVLRSVVQEDPDVLVVADVGAPETFELALRAAEGGRLVIAWIDAQGVVPALGRILNFYPAHELPRVRASLAAVLQSVLVRHLLPDAPRKGLVPATELLVVGDAARESVRAGSLGDLALLMRAEDGGGHSLDQSMLKLVRQGRTRLEDVFVRADQKGWLLEQTSGLSNEENA